MQDIVTVKMGIYKCKNCGTPTLAIGDRAEWPLCLTCDPFWDDIQERYVDTVVSDIDA